MLYLGLAAFGLMALLTLSAGTASADDKDKLAMLRELAKAAKPIGVEKKEEPKKKR